MATDSNPSSQKLFSPVMVGPLTLSHRVVMTPLTRPRSDRHGDVPNDMMAKSYAQRASDGELIVSEATTASITGSGCLGAPDFDADHPSPAAWRLASGLQVASEESDRGVRPD